MCQQSQLYYHVMQYSASMDLVTLTQSAWYVRARSHIDLQNLMLPSYQLSSYYTKYVEKCNSLIAHVKAL